MPITDHCANCGHSVDDHTTDGDLSKCMADAIEVHTALGSFWMSMCDIDCDGYVTDADLAADQSEHAFRHAVDRAMELDEVRT